MVAKRIYRYLQGTKEKGLVFNPPKKMAVNCYVGADFTIIPVHENPQDPICASSRTGFMEAFNHCPLLWLQNIQTDIDLSTLHSEYVILSNSVRYLLPLNNLIK